jgi:hypothetical protein
MIPPETVTPPDGEAAGQRLARAGAALRALASPSVLLAATAILVVILYGRLLGRSFWVDEAGTFWMAHEGPLAALRKTWRWPGQSILFSIVSSLFCFDGNPYRDQILRIPSLLGIAAACYFLYRFAEDAIGRGAGGIASTLFVLSPMALEFGTQARPYALAMAAAAASCWTLVRWVSTHDRRWLVWYALSSALVLHLHYLFSLVLLAHAVFLLAEVTVRKRLVRWRELLLAYAAIGFLVAPLVPHFMLLLRESHTLPFAPKPTIEQLPVLLLPSTMGAGLLLAGLLVHSLFRERPPVVRPQSLPLLAMVMTLWVVCPLIVFAASSATPMRMFLNRYVSYSELGLVIALAFAGYSMFGSRAGRAWALLGMAAITASPLRLVFEADVGREELRPFLDVIRQESVRTRSLPPVFFRSELVESSFYDWRSGNAKGSYLYAPFVAYVMPNPLLPLPYRLTDEVKEQVAGWLESGLKDRSEVLLVTHEESWIPWFTNRFETAGFGARVLRPNGFCVVVFERSDAARND